jgi:hypothetical protein
VVQHFAGMSEGVHRQGDLLLWTPPFRMWGVRCPHPPFTVLFFFFFFFLFFASRSPLGGTLDRSLPRSPSAAPKVPPRRGMAGTQFFFSSARRDVIDEQWSVSWTSPRNPAVVRRDVEGGGGGGCPKESATPKIAGMAPFFGRGVSVWIVGRFCFRGVRMAIDGNQRFAQSGAVTRFFDRDGTPSSGRVMIGNCDPWGGRKQKIKKKKKGGGGVRPLRFKWIERTWECVNSMINSIDDHLIIQ